MISSWAVRTSPETPGEESLWPDPGPVRPSLVRAGLTLNLLLLPLLPLLHLLLLNLQISLRKHLRPPLCLRTHLSRAREVGRGYTHPSSRCLRCMSSSGTFSTTLATTQMWSPGWTSVMDVLRWALTVRFSLWNVGEGERHSRVCQNVGEDEVQQIWGDELWEDVQSYEVRQETGSINSTQLGQIKIK